MMGTMRQHGDDGDNVGTTWGQCRDNMGTMWGQHEDHGDHEITKNAITFELIKIIQFCLKIWDP